MNAPSRVERLGTEKIGKLLLEMSSQTTLSLLVYAIYSVTDTYFLSVGINSLAAAGASIISPVLMALGALPPRWGLAAHRRFRGRSARRKRRRLPGRSPIP